MLVKPTARSQPQPRLAQTARDPKGRRSIRMLAAEFGFSEDVVAAIPEHAGTSGLPEYVPVAPSLGMLDPLPTDLKLVRIGLRPSALLHGPEPWVASVAAWAHGRGLHAWPSAVAFRPATADETGSYSNLAADRRPASAKDNEWRAIAVSASPALAGLMWVAEAAGWDTVLGYCLGYPPCCVQAFERDWPEAVRTHMGDLGRMRLPRDGTAAEIPAALNVYARYFGPVLTDHFPCALSCKASLSRAARLSEGLAALDPQLLSDIDARMRCDITLDEAGWRQGRVRRSNKVTISVKVLREVV